MAETRTSIIRDWRDIVTRAVNKTHLLLPVQSEATPQAKPSSHWLARIIKRRPSKSPYPEWRGSYSLEEIHRRLKAVNSQIWRELRRGFLAGCHAGLYSVRLEDWGETLDWREVNRLTVSALRAFETATTDLERITNLDSALMRIGQKLLIVRKAALRKADRLSIKEEREILKSEGELRHISHILQRLSSYK